MQTKIELIGVGGATLEEHRLNIARKCGVVVASSRHKPLLEGEEMVIVPIAPVQTMLAELEKFLEKSDVAVLASGDPLFFGVGRTLIERFGSERVNVHPALSSVQLACAAFKIPWDDMVLLSLHGRDAGDLPAKILPHRKVMLFTDHRNSPDKVAASLIKAFNDLDEEQCIQGIQVKVAENLGLENERFVEGGLPEIAASEFGPLNIMLLEQVACREPGCVFGLNEVEIVHSRGLITKDEVRAVTLHRLRLPKSGVFWDVGGGSGSVSIEAAALCPGLSVHCVEKEEEQLKNLRRNIVKHGTYNVQAVAGIAPEVFADLPDPDRIFVGGSGGALKEIIEQGAARLKKGGRIVVNAVLAATAKHAPEYLQQSGLSVDIRNIRISRRTGSEGEEEELNPISVITGIKKND